MKKILLISLALGLLIFINSCSQTEPKYRNIKVAPEERADDLLKRLTIKEKISLMMNASDSIPRLGIKKYDWWNEALHGVARNGTATVFPQAIGMAASFDDSLVYEVFKVVSDEARVKYNKARRTGEIKRYQGLTMWTPNINIFRDPRWGRGQETYGEDPYLTSVMGVAVIKGLQGEETDGYLKLLACAKHYAVHSGPEWNRHSFDVNNISPRDLWETYLPAFEAAVKKGKVKQVMCAYNRFEGEPCCGSDRLLINILREKWQYDGIVVSDCGAINNFYQKGKHMTHPDSAHAVADAVLSGTDIECGSSYKALLKAVNQNLISEQKIDVSLKRLIFYRYKLGEIYGKSPWDNLPDSLLCCKKHKDIALEMARKSIVLLQNKGILPLNSNSSIALLGPNANNDKMQWGNYNGIPTHTITLLEALQNHFPNKKIAYDEACSYTGNTESIIDECTYNKKKGISAMFWNNIDMNGQPVYETIYSKIIKIGKRDTLPGISLEGISAKFNTVLIPKISGPVDFVFTTSGIVKLIVNGKEIKLEKIPIEFQVAKMNLLAGKKYKIEIEYIKKENGQFIFDIKRNIKTDINRIIKLVEKNDIIIFAGGISAELEREEANVYASGFVGGDRVDIELPAVQREIIAALKAAGKKVILVNFSGSAMGLEPETKNCEAIIQAWYPGEAGGQAIVDVLFGNYNPAGRLPVTFYKNINQLPDFENYQMKGRTYRYTKEKPLFPFGYGLSYTSFKYSDIKIDKQEIKPGDTLKLYITITNDGKYDGEEVIQVYLKKVSDIEGPNKTLRAFKRVFIPAGNKINIVFNLTDDNLKWWDNVANTIKVSSGEYQLMIGKSSKDEDLTFINFKIK